MKKVMIGLLLASAAAATPAQARDGSWYAGIEGGALWAKDTHVDYGFDFGDGSVAFDSKIKYSTGTDADLIGGYDWGMFRTELELGYKHVTHRMYETNAEYTYGGYYDTKDTGYGKTDVYSAMVNLLFDGGNPDGFSFYAGPGIGFSNTRIEVQDRAYDTNNFTIKDSGLAFQGIAGVRYAISPNLDVGLKYRYFYGNKISDSFDAGFSTDVDVDASRFKSHSLLASLVYNFWTPMAPPPPVVVAPAPMPEPAPQMQTCYDGSMIPVTAVCPSPPTPAPAPQPGERG